MHRAHPLANFAVVPSERRSGRCSKTLGLLRPPSLEDAREAGAELLKVNPEFSISRYEAQAPYANREDLDRYVTGLRMAGLPE